MIDFKSLINKALSGDAIAQYELGCCYEALQKDYKKAAEWFRKSAEQGYAKAQYNLGAYYYNGTGVERNNLKAFFWFNVAHDNGDKFASAYLEQVQESLTDAESFRVQWLSLKWTEDHRTKPR